VTSAIFGLVGVIVGAVVTGAVDVFMEYRRKQGAVFKAKRLVGEELQTIWMHLDGLIDRGTTPMPLSDERRAAFMPTRAWDTFKETLAQKGVISNDDWVQLSTALHAVTSLRVMILDEPPRTPLPPELREHVYNERAIVAGLCASITGSSIPVEPSTG
jgi:hypothetical protein